MKFKIGKLVFWHFVLYLAVTLKGYAVRVFDMFSTHSIDMFKYTVLASTSMLAFFAFSLLAYGILFFCYDRKSNYFTTLLIALAVTFSIGFRYFLQEILQKSVFGFGNYFSNISARYYILDNLYYAIIFTSFGAIFFFIQYSKHKDLVKNELLLENKKTELALLRSQINPHFLFNTLNNIYTLIYQKSDDSLFAVERLTSLLRYAIYEKEDKVLLGKEIEAINDFIALQKMRYDYEPALKVEIEAGNEKLKIAPFLFIPYLENAFKHGNLNVPDQPTIIKLYSSKEDLVFNIVNEISLKNKDEVGGVGLENIERRLQLIYKDKHDLKIKNDGINFEVTIKISLSEC